MIKDVNLTVRKGEIVGIAGPDGRGAHRTRDVRLRAQLRAQASAARCGCAASRRRPARWRRPSTRGIAYVTEDRKALGLVLESTILHNITLAQPVRRVAQRRDRQRREAQVAEDYRQRLSIRAPGVQQKVVNLSGGNQQKVVLSKWLFTDPQVLILDEPTRGIDVGAKFEIYTS